MTLAEALQVVCDWLAMTGATIRPLTARETTLGTHFELLIEQLLPQQRRRAFVIEPEGVPDAWRVTELGG